MEEDYIFDLQNDDQLWGDNKLPELNVEDMFKNMNEDLFNKLENMAIIDDTYLGLNKEISKSQTSKDIIKEDIAHIKPISGKILMYGICSLGSGCKKPATHMYPFKESKTLQSIKMFSCETHTLNNMVSIDSWLCKSSKSKHYYERCRNKARCYIEDQSNPVYCPTHANIHWPNCKYKTNK